MPPREASQLRGIPAQTIFCNENRARINEQLLSNDPDLRRRCENDEDSDDQCEAEEELYDLAQPILRQEYNALSEFEKSIFEQKSLEAKHNHWRRFRMRGDLIENEESLAQKAQDDILIAQGVSVNDLLKMSVAQQQQQQTAFTGSAAKPSKESMIPPFCSKESKYKNFGVLAGAKDEEYF